MVTTRQEIDTAEASIDDVTTQVMQSFQHIEDARNKILITNLVQKLHDYINEIQLTQSEWEYIIDYLTRTGQMCHEQRQEYILLSDVLGVSMLVDQINNQKSEIQTP